MSNDLEQDVKQVAKAGKANVDNKHPTHIWLITAPKTGDEKPTPKQLTSGRYDEGNVTWAKDSSLLYFVSNRTDEPYYDLPSTDIYTVSVSGGQPTKLTTFDMGSGQLSVSPDGKRFAFYASVSKPVQSYTEPDLWVMDIASNAQPKKSNEGFWI